MAFLAGTLSCFGHAPYFLWPFFLISGAGFAHCLEVSLSRRKVFLSSFLFGLIYGFGVFLSGLFWVANAFTERGPEFAFWGGPAIVLLALGLAIFWAMGATLYTRLARRLQTKPVLKALLFGAIFFCTEYLRGHILTGFPWGLAGYIWEGGGAVSQGASLIGVYGLTFLTLLLAGSLRITYPTQLSLKTEQKPFSFFRPFLSPFYSHKIRSSFICYFLTVFLFATPLFLSGIYGKIRLQKAPDLTNVSGITFRLVAPSLEQKKKWDSTYYQEILNKYIQLSTQNGMEEITYLIWPEAALPTLLLENQQTLNQLSKIFEKGPILITGTVRREQDLQSQHTYFYNSLVVLDFTQHPPALMGLYDKIHLVPFGEYIPFSSILRKVGLEDWAALGELKKGKNHQIITIGNTLPAFSAQICYEIIFPRFTQQKENTQSPKWIANLSNDSWYGLSSGPLQHENQVRYRAIETGLPVLRAASLGFTGMITPYGQSDSPSVYNQDTVIDTTLPQALAKPLYAKVGSWPVFIILVMILLFCLRALKP